MLALEKLFQLTLSTQFPWFFGTYNAGLILTTAMMGVHGTFTVLDKDVSSAISGIAGLGHILMAIGLVLFFLVLRTHQKVVAFTGPSEHVGLSAHRMCIASTTTETDGRAVRNL